VENRTRYISIRFRVSPEELRILEQKQQESRISNREAFIRKQIMEGQILILNVPELRKITSLLSYCSNNLNQIAKRVNSGYMPQSDDLRAMRETLDTMTNDIRGILEKLNTL